MGKERVHENVSNTSNVFQKFILDSMAKDLQLYLSIIKMLDDPETLNLFRYVVEGVLLVT